MVGILICMSVLCRAVDEHFVLGGIEDLQEDVVISKANPGWSAKTVSKTGELVRDSALTRGRAVERLLRQSILDERELAVIMTAVDRALENCPE